MAAGAHRRPNHTGLAESMRARSACNKVSITYGSMRGEKYKRGASVVGLCECAQSEINIQCQKGLTHRGKWNHNFAGQGGSHFVVGRS